MNKRVTMLFAILTVSLSLSYAQSITLSSVHSHNDYKQERPFWEAYEAGCGSIEVDIFLRNDSLFAAHEAKEITTERTLEVLYLKPVTEVLREAKAKKFQLLIDIKTEAEPTLERLITELQKYPILLTQQKVKFVISGNRPEPKNYKNYPPYIFFDHQTIEDLNDIDLGKVALISLPFHKTAFWTGKEELTEANKQKIAGIVKVIHAKNLPFRFWATPDTELSWKTMSDLGVDFINTDKPKACTSFVKNISPKTRD